ncbi:MAG TPA: potassium channel family protein [Candidatus Acidoferrales bacterium]
MTEFLHSLLMQIPDDFKPWAALMLGSLILVCLVLFHGAGIHWILIYHQRNGRRLWLGRPHHIEATILFGTSVFLMLVLHIFGVLVWAFALAHLGLILRANDAIYFCANAYTTLGYGAVDIDPMWRNISPIIGISGLFTFAWTTSALVGVVTGHNRLLEQLEIEREKQLELRAAARGAVGAVRTQETAAERAARVKIAGEHPGGGVRGRLENWQDENREIEAMRETERARIAEIRRKEGSDEDKLGPGMPNE